MRKAEAGGSLSLGITRIAVVLMAVLTAPVFAESGLKVVLITEQEATLPVASVPEMTFRAGVTRGPKVTLIFPTAIEDSTHSPVHIEFRFEAHGGAKIDPKSVKITYLKNPSVDLTERIRPFVGFSGIDLPAAEVPPGNHPIRVEVRDSEGRYSSVIFTLKVSQ